MLARRWLWLATIGLLLTSAVLGWASGRRFGAGAAVAGLTFLLAFVATIWRAHFVNTVGRFRSMDPPSARVVFGDHNLTVASNLGISTVPWSSFKELWDLDDAWLLFLTPNQFMSLPMAGLPETVRNHIRARVTPKRLQRHGLAVMANPSAERPAGARMECTGPVTAIVQVW